MHGTTTTDEELLSARDAASFELFYCRHVDPLLGFFQRRTRDPELAADLTAETFAAALASRRRYRPEAGSAARWLYGIGAQKLDDSDYARIEALGDEAPALALVERLAPEQREAITAHVLEERGYAEIADELHTSEAVVRKRVSRGLATMRQRMGMRR